MNLAPGYSSICVQSSVITYTSATLRHRVLCPGSSPSVPLFSHLRLRLLDIGRDRSEAVEDVAAEGMDHVAGPDEPEATARVSISGKQRQLDSLGNDPEEDEVEERVVADIRIAIEELNAPCQCQHRILPVGE